MSKDADEKEAGETQVLMNRRESVKAIGGVVLGALGTSGPTWASSLGTAAKDRRLEGKVAFITGSARGIGRATAVAMAQEGAHIVNVDVAQSGASAGPKPATTQEHSETEELVKREGGRCLSIVADVRNLGQLKKATQRAIQEFGKIDILVANAGVIGKLQSTQTMTEENWNEVIDVNLVGVARSFLAVIPHMIERKSGVIIALSSIAGRAGVSEMAVYSASKWGVIGLVKSAAIDLGPFGIRVNAICPCWTRTEMLQYLAGPHLKEEEETLKRFSPMRRGAIEPEEVARACLFLASDEASAISGIALDVQAGLNARNLG